MKVELKETVFDDLTEICMQALKEKKSSDIYDLLEQMMDDENVPMHYPYHHFIMPAALLTAAAIEMDMGQEELRKMLMKARERGKMVPPGACGNMGACGAGVGAGIFMSIFTDASPHSEETWQWANEITARCLQKIASVPGPRCCKRTVFLSAAEAAAYIKEKLDLNLKIKQPHECKYFDRNVDCKKEECPFYPAVKEIPIIVPESAMPRKDEENPCPCQNEPVKLIYKKGKLTWQKKIGDAVQKGELICEAEVEKKVIEFLAPANGILSKILVEDGGKFKAGDVLGYILN